jgi:hypothetical protein
MVDLPSSVRIARRLMSRRVLLFVPALILSSLVLGILITIGWLGELHYSMTAKVRRKITASPVSPSSANPAAQVADIGASMAPSAARPEGLATTNELGQAHERQSIRLFAE